MDRAATSCIDVCEAAYDLRLGPEDWLPNLLDRGAALFNRGLGCAAAVWSGTSDDAQPILERLCVSGGAPELGDSFALAARDVGARLPHTSAARDAGARTASETVHEPSILRAFEKRVGCKDVLGVWALDPGLHGVGINIPSSSLISLSRGERLRWQRLVTHIAAGHRLRRRLGCTAEVGETPLGDLPFDDAVVIDPKRFDVKHAKGTTKNEFALEALRDAAIRLDQARGTMRHESPERALEVWHGLIRGQCSLVDWFDSDGRRFMVVIPNEPGSKDARALTDRERQVVECAARGDASKAISYELGVSRQRVSMLLTSAMRKLGVRTQAQLVMKMRMFGGVPKSASLRAV